MIRFRRPAVTPRAAADGTLAVVHCPEAFTLAPGHRMRAAHCLICSSLIGGQPATVVGVAALAGEACTCGGVAADLFLIHAVHFPVGEQQLAAALRRGGQCPADHEWSA